MAAEQVQQRPRRTMVRQCDSRIRQGHLPVQRGMGRGRAVQPQARADRRVRLARRAAGKRGGLLLRAWTSRCGGSGRFAGRGHAAGQHCDQQQRPATDRRCHRALAADAAWVPRHLFDRWRGLPVHRHGTREGGGMGTGIYRAMAPPASTRWAGLCGACMRRPGTCTADRQGAAGSRCGGLLLPPRHAGHLGLDAHRARTAYPVTRQLRRLTAPAPPVSVA